MASQGPRPGRRIFEFLDSDGAGVTLVAHDTGGSLSESGRELLALEITMHTPDGVIAYPARTTDSTFVQNLAQLMLRAARQGSSVGRLPACSDRATRLLVHISDYQQPEGRLGVLFQCVRSLDDPDQTEKFDQTTVSATQAELQAAVGQVLSLLADEAERERITAFIHSAGVGGEWARMAAESSGACASCRSSHAQLEQVVDRLDHLAFNVSQSYQMDRLHRCNLCGTFWLQQYWEEFDAADPFSEFGTRYEEWTELTADDVASIAEAMDTGRLLSQRRFWA